MDKVIINWVDSAVSPNRWDYLDKVEPLPPLKCETVGFLFEDTPEYKTIAQTISDNLVLNRITIPTVSIIKIQKIKNDEIPAEADKAEQK